MLERKKCQVKSWFPQVESLPTLLDRALQAGGRPRTARLPAYAGEDGYSSVTAIFQKRSLNLRRPPVTLKLTSNSLGMGVHLLSLMVGLEQSS